ncbi:MAG: S41 family peptidase [Agriterribacter sp.]
MRIYLLSAFALLWCIAAHAQQKGYYRYPAIYDNTVVFTAEGDLWTYDIVANRTSRLTTHAGMESAPCFSADGKQLVFVGQYEGPSELYVMPATGGVPKRITYDGSAVYPSGFLSNGKILFRSNLYTQIETPQLFIIDPVSLQREAIPLWQASLGVYDADGNLYFTRYPNQGSKTKRYQGGLIEQVWKFDSKNEAVNLTGDFKGTSTSPMFYNGKVYFLSDRDGTMNLWSMNTSGKELTQQTFSKGWDLQTPSLQNGRVVYQKGADVWLYDIPSKQEKLLPITLQSDFDQRKPRWIKNPSNSISDADLSPNGNYAALISRGRVFVSPAKSDRWVEIRKQDGIRNREVHFIDDKNIAVLSDKTGEFEIWKLSADGSDSAHQVTHDTKTLIKNFSVSPDAKWVAFMDKNEVLRVADMKNGKVQFTYDSSYSGVQELVWSPDSRYLIFSHGISNLSNQICLYDVRKNLMRPITTSRLDSYSPSWSKDSKWLYFLSDRNLKTRVYSPWGSRQPEPYYTETTNIYAMSLDSAARFPFVSEDSWLSDSLWMDKKEPAADEKDKSKKNKPAKPVTEKEIDWAKVTDELYQIPVKSGNFARLNVTDGYLYWLDRGNGDGREGASLMSLKIEASKKYEPTEIAKGVAEIIVSQKKNKVLVFYQNSSMAIGDANGQKVDADKSKLSLDNWSYVLDPVQDWKQIFHDAWLLMRDYFYDTNMHAVNWLAVRKQYEPLVERITDRYELDDLISQMVGELSALHTFVGGGDKRYSPDQMPMAFLGAHTERVAQGEKILHIYRSDPDYPDFRPPLAMRGSKIREGDIITTIDNTPVSEVAAVQLLLLNKVNRPVKLSLVDKNGKKYDEVIKPCAWYTDNIMRYNEWELTNREKVDSISKNDIGYVHLKAMGSNDMDDFVKQFYPVFNRSGLIIDVRNNNGGNIDSWVLEKLMRKAWMYWQARSGKPTWNMQYAFRGHMVILCDQQTASDGEAISEGFRRLGLGKVIGMRTWGGEIWLTGSNRLVDNGVATAAEFGVYGPEGKWLIEGEGVIPDIEVDNLPFETYKGKDAQLEYAIKHLQQLIKEKPVPVPPAPLHPKKAFIYGQEKP